MWLTEREARARHGFLRLDVSSRKDTGHMIHVIWSHCCSSICVLRWLWMQAQQQLCSWVQAWLIVLPGNEDSGKIEVQIAHSRSSSWASSDAMSISPWPSSSFRRSLISSSWCETCFASVFLLRLGCDRIALRSCWILARGGIFVRALAAMMASPSHCIPRFCQFYLVTFQFMTSPRIRLTFAITSASSCWICVSILDSARRTWDFLKA